MGVPQKLISKESLLPELEAYYLSDIKPLMLSYEDRRNAIYTKLKWIQLLIAVIIISIVIAVYFTASDIVASKESIIGILVAWIFPAVLVWSYMTNGLRDELKDLSIGKMCGFLGWSYQRKNFSPLKLDDFYRLMLLPQGTYNAQFEDQIAGDIEGRRFVLQELRLSKRSNNSAVDPFLGQLIKIDCSKKFLGETVVLRKKFDPPRQIDGKLKKVGLVSKKFNDTFNVYSTDQVEARFLLPPNFMQQLLDFEAVIDGKNLRFGFVNKALLITVETENRYEVSDSFDQARMMDSAKKNMRELYAISEITRNLTSK